MGAKGKGGTLNVCVEALATRTGEVRDEADISILTALSEEKTLKCPSIIAS
jgi:hypothetical protein